MHMMTCYFMYRGVTSHDIITYVSKSYKETKEPHIPPKEPHIPPKEPCILCIERLHHMTSSHMYQEVIRRQKSPIFRQKSPIFRQKSHVSYVSSTWLMWYNSLMHMMRCHFMYGGVTSRDIMIYDITWHHHICIKKLYRDKRAPYSAKRAPYSAKRALYPVYRGVISHNILMHISRSYGVATIRSVGSL